MQGKFVENQTFAVLDCESSIGNDRNDENDKLNLWQVLLPLLPLLMLLASCRKSAEETTDNLRIEKLHQLDELLNAQSPQAKTEIEKV